MRRLILFLLATLLLGAAATGCGQKGDLYLEPVQPPAAGEQDRDDEEGDG